MKPQCKIKTQHSDSRHQEVCLGQAPHTPTPWERDFVGRTLNESDAAFIVRAVNCHEELLELSRIITTMACPSHGELRKRAREAIAKAEAK